MPTDIGMCLKSKVLEFSIFIMFLSRVSWFQVHGISIVLLSRYGIWWCNNSSWYLVKVFLSLHQWKTMGNFHFLIFLPFSFNYTKCKNVIALQNCIFSVQQIANTCAVTRMIIWCCPNPNCKLLVGSINYWTLVNKDGPLSSNVFWSIWWIKGFFWNIWYIDVWDVPIDIGMFLKFESLESSLCYYQGFFWSKYMVSQLSYCLYTKFVVVTIHHDI